MNFSLPVCLAGLLLVAGGYLSGSFLASYYLPLWLCRIDVTADAPDHNPGAFNAFAAAGVPMGVLCVFCDIAKGILPVWAAGFLLGPDTPWLAPVLAAPVLGHAFPLFRRGQGGKAIAVSFGALIGLWPRWFALWLLIAFYLLFSLVLVVSPNGARSVLTYVLWLISVFVLVPQRSIVLGCAVIGVTVICRHSRAAVREKAHVHLFGRA